MERRRFEADASQAVARAQAIAAKSLIDIQGQLFDQMHEELLRIEQKYAWEIATLTERLLACEDRSQELERRANEARPGVP